MRAQVLFLSICMAATFGVRSQIIVTVAGNHAAGAGYSGDGGPATSARLNNPAGVTVDAAGNLYIADAGNHVIRKVDASGIITTVAGSGIAGFSGDGGPATAAKLNSPIDVAFDAAGNMYIADELNQRVRKIDINGNISTVAGNGVQGYSGNAGPATSANLDHPYRVLTDNNGNLYIAEAYNYVIRQVNTSGIINVFAGTHNYGYSGNGVPATTANMTEPTGLARDGAGNFYFSDEYNNRIRMINTSGNIITLAGNGSAGNTGDGGPGLSATLNYPLGMCADAAGNVYIPDRYSGTVRYYNINTGIISTIVGTGTSGYSGDGGNPLSAQLNTPVHMCLDGNGSLYIADNANSVIRKICLPANLNVSGTTSLCTPAGSTVLTASGASTYTWSANAGSAGTSTVSVSPGGTTTYTVSTNDNGCPFSKTITVTVTPTPTLNIAGNLNICSGSSTTLTGSGATSYTWNTGTVTVNTTTLNTAPMTTVTYTLTGANGNCTDTRTVTVNVTPTPTLVVSGNTNLCQGQSTTLTGTGGTTYTWVTSSNGNTTTTTSTNSVTTITIVPSVTTTYTLTGAAGVCAAGNTVVTTVNVNPLPVVTFTLPALTDTVCYNSGLYPLNGGSPANGTYSGLGVSGGASFDSHVGIGPFVITYVYTDPQDCSNSATDTLIVDPCGLGIVEYGGETISAFPNPTRDVLNIAAGSLPANTRAELTDMAGRMVTSLDLTLGQTQIDMASLSSGVYYLQLVSGGTVIYRSKIVKY